MTSVKKLSLSQKITNYFDNKEWTHTRSRLRDRGDQMQSYDPAHSWDGRSDESESFSRLRSKELPLQNSKKSCLSGGAVLVMERRPDGLAGLNIHRTGLGESGAGNLPLTTEQQDVGMRKDLTATMPICEATNKQDGEVVVMESNARFENMGVKTFNLKTDREPSFYRAAGPQLDQKLLTPSQRREIMEFEKRKFAADAVMRKAVSDRQKLKIKLQGPEFHRGVLMYDDAINPNSEVYGEKASKYLDEKSRHETFMEQRRSYMGARGSSIVTDGNILVPESLPLHKPVRKFYQSKGGEFHNQTFEETFNDLNPKQTFDDKEMSFRQKRMQHLRDQDHNGKQYNMITGVEVTYLPSTAPERVNKTLAHPSQTTIYGQRNMQGSIRPDPCFCKF